MIFWQRFLTHFPAIPKRIDEAIRKCRYVDYSLLSRSSREKSTKDQEALTLVDGQIQMSSKIMSPGDEREMGQIDWIAAAETVEKKTL